MLGGPVRDQDPPDRSAFVRLVMSADALIDEHDSILREPVPRRDHGGRSARRSQARSVENLVCQALIDARAAAIALGIKGAQDIVVDHLTITRARAVSEQLKRAAPDIDWMEQIRKMNEAA